MKKLEKEINELTETINKAWNNLELGYEMGILNDEEVSMRRANIQKFERLLSNMKASYQLKKEYKEKKNNNN